MCPQGQTVRGAAGRRHPVHPLSVAKKVKVFSLSVAKNYLYIPNKFVNA